MPPILRHTTFVDEAPMTALLNQLQSVLLNNSVRGVRFGTSSEDVFQLAYLMSAISNSLPKSEVKKICKDLNIHEKVWMKFLRIVNDSRLNAMRDSNHNLPNSYTALYALSVMNDDEFAAYMYETELNCDTPSRAILDWTRQYRTLCQMAN